MSTELPPQIQNQVAQLQQLQQQAQALAVQRSQLELALNEAKQTIADTVIKWIGFQTVKFVDVFEKPK